MKRAPINTQLDQSGDTQYGEKFLTNESLSLIEFAKGAVSQAGGFGYLDSSGAIDPSKPREVYIQCRMTQVFGLAHLLGLSDSYELVDHGVKSILNLFHDKTNDGFFNAIDNAGEPTNASKLAYDHMFVLLAASTAKAVKHPRADELFHIIDSLIDKYYWDPKYEMMNNSWDLELKNLDEYRGINANMHAVEALCAAFDVTADSKFLDRAYSICKTTVDRFAKENDWLLPEHFTDKWQVLKDFNIENPADPFRPFGVTIGHLFEWSRLILQLEIQMKGSTQDLSWIKSGAKSLYDAAKRYGWAVDGAEGFVYTIDWDKKPVVRSRMHWVAAEAVMTAYTLWKVTGELEYLEDYNTWWQYIDKNLIDKEAGSWFHELDPYQEVVEGTWSGKPDVYHALNACLLPLYPLDASFIGTAIRTGRSFDE